MALEILLKVIATLAAGGIVWALTKSAIRFRRFVHERRTITLGDSIHNIVPATERDLPDLLTLYTRYFGDDVPALQAMRTWMKRSRTAFWIVRDEGPRSDTASKLVGSFKILPITKSGMAALDQEKVSGSTFADQHVAQRRSQAVAYYVGDVVGVDRGAQAAIVMHLRRLFSTELAAYPVYARPLTSDGQRVMRKLGFQCVSDASVPTIPRICRLDPRPAVGPNAVRTRRRITGSSPATAH